MKVYLKKNFLSFFLFVYLYFLPLCFQQHAQMFWSICVMFRASAHLPVKTWKILMERKSGSSGKHQNDLPLGGPCSWCHNTTHADRLQKTCFTGVSDISTTISLIDVVTDASFTSDLWIPAVMQRITVVPISRIDTEISNSGRWCTFISQMYYCLGAIRWRLVL